MSYPSKQLFAQIRAEENNLVSNTLRLLSDLHGLFARFPKKTELTADLINGFGSAQEADQYLVLALYHIQEYVIDVRKHIYATDALTQLVQSGAVKEGAK